MTVQDVLTAISTVGFPIVCCIALVWVVYKIQSQHKAEIDKLSEAVNNNTLVMQKFLDKMGG